MKTTFHLALDDSERSMIIRSLNDIRSRLIAEGKYTDGVDDVLVKVIVQRKRNSKLVIRRIDYYERNECTLSKSRQLSTALYHNKRAKGTTYRRVGKPTQTVS